MKVIRVYGDTHKEVFYAALKACRSLGQKIFDWDGESLIVLAWPDGSYGGVNVYINPLHNTDMTVWQRVFFALTKRPAYFVDIHRVQARR